MHGRSKSKISGEYLTNKDLAAERKQHDSEQRARDSRAENSRKIEQLEKQVAAQKPAPAPPPPKPAPKPEPKKEPVVSPIEQMGTRHDPYEFNKTLKARNERVAAESNAPKSYDPEAGVNNDNGAGDFMNDYKIDIQNKMDEAGADTRGPDSINAPKTDDDDKDDEVTYNV